MFHGLTRALINNMVVGVDKGYTKKMLMIGVGYNAKVQGKTLVMNLGFSHPINFAIPEGIKIETPTNTEIVVSGFDKQLVGQVSANIRKYREPERFTPGKGIRYSDEIVITRPGKTGSK